MTHAQESWGHFLVGQFAVGGIAGGLALGLLLACDLGGLGRLILRDDDTWIVIVVLLAAFAGTFGAAALGTRLADPPDADGSAWQSSGASKPY